MDYDVVSNAVQGAYNNFRYNDKKFNEYMGEYYRLGKENPSVAKIIKKDRLHQIKENTKKIMVEVAALPTYSFLDIHTTCASEKTYRAILNTKLKIMEAEEFYNNKQHSDKEYIKNALAQKKECDEVWESNYPKTGALRERIIDRNRISLTNVSRKANWIDKIAIVKSADEYKKLYSKTYLTRYFLLESKQIKEGSITPSVKNWFMRLGYKMLIKGHFGFKK